MECSLGEQAGQLEVARSGDRPLERMLIRLASLRKWLSSHTCSA